MANFLVCFDRRNKEEVWPWIPVWRRHDRSAWLKHTVSRGRLVQRHLGFYSSKSVLFLWFSAKKWQVIDLATCQHCLVFNVIVNSVVIVFLISVVLMWECIGCVWFIALECVVPGYLPSLESRLQRWDLNDFLKGRMLDRKGSLLIDSVKYFVLLPDGSTSMYLPTYHLTSVKVGRLTRLLGYWYLFQYLGIW